MRVRVVGIVVRPMGRRALVAVALASVAFVSLGPADVRATPPVMAPASAGLADEDPADEGAPADADGSGLDDPTGPDRAGQGDLNVVCRANIVVAINVGRPGAVERASASQRIRIRQDGRETVSASDETTAVCDR